MMNFGGFAGGFSHGFNNGVSMAKTIRDVIKDRKLQDLREQGMAEAEAQRAKSVQDMVKENGVGEQPDSGPVDTSTPKVEMPEVATATPVRTGTVETQSLPSLPPGVGASSEGSQGEAEATANMKKPAVVQPTPNASQQPQAAAATPQAVAAEGVKVKPNGKFSVNGKSYDTRDQAMAAAEKSAPSSTDLFMKNTVPKLAAQYVVNGDPEKAKAWTDYAESVNGKRAIKDWAAAYSAPDFDTAATRFGKYYTDHIDDGVDYTGHRMLTKADGSQVAVVALKDKATGATTEMELTREKMLAMGGANNPQKLFESEQAKQAAEASQKAKIGEKVFESKLRMGEKGYELDRKDQGEAKKAEYAKDLEHTKGQQKLSEISLNGQYKLDVARLKSTLGEDGADAYKKATSPEERAAIIRSNHKDDTKFQKMTPDEQDSFIQREIEANQKIGKNIRSGSASSENPASPAKTTSPSAPVYARDKTTGQIFELRDGKKIPVGSPAKPAQPGPSGGLPAKSDATGSW
jgi:hypothetical protein